MRAVVLEKKNGIAAVLKEDGTFATFKGNCEVGDEVEISDAPQFTLLSKGAVGTKVRRYGLAAAAATAAAITAAGRLRMCPWMSIRLWNLR